jgi:hypothetical protein
LEWQEDVIRFFDTVKLSDETKNDAGDAYIELSWKVHHELGKLNVYFEVKREERERRLSSEHKLAYISTLHSLLFLHTKTMPNM